MRIQFNRKRIQGWNLEKIIKIDKKTKRVAIKRIRAKIERLKNLSG